MDVGIEGRLVTLEQRLRRDRVLLGAACLLLAAACIALWLRPAPDRLRLSELVVVDPAGVERVRLSDDMPDAVIDGRRIDRETTCNTCLGVTDL